MANSNPSNLMSIERMSNAAAAIETIALNNSELLEQHYGTDKADVLALVSLARAHWYQLSRGGK